MKKSFAESLKKQFKKWLENAARCEQFKNGYNYMSKKEKELYELAFWEAVEFLKDREAEKIERKKVTELFK